MALDSDAAGRSPTDVAPDEGTVAEAPVPYIGPTTGKAFAARVG